jgi:phosphopantetheine--protein transferase-like protein
LQNIGNDIVDLTHPQAIARYEDYRFVSRVLTLTEQEKLRSSSFPNQCLWSFWAAKESAYKAISRFFPLVSSSPKQYEVSMEDIGFPSIFHGMVTTPEMPVQIQGAVRTDYVHCLGVTGKEVDNQIIETGIYPISKDKDESSFVRELAKDRMAECLKTDFSQIQIRRKIIANQPGPPEVFVQGEKIPICISLSHDGRFAAFAFTRLDSLSL